MRSTIVAFFGLWDVPLECIGSKKCNATFCAALKAISCYTMSPDADPQQQVCQQMMDKALWLFC